MKIIVDRAACIGAASCVAVAPHLFELDDEDKAAVIDPDPDDLDAALRAARACPEAAIAVVDDSGKQRFPD